MDNRLGEVIKNVGNDIIDDISMICNTNGFFSHICNIIVIKIENGEFDSYFDKTKYNKNKNLACAWFEERGIMTASQFTREKTSSKAMDMNLFNTICVNAKINGRQKLELLIKMDNGYPETIVYNYFIDNDFWLEKEFRKIDESYTVETKIHYYNLIIQYINDNSEYKIRPYINNK